MRSLVLLAVSSRQQRPIDLSHPSSTKEGGDFVRADSRTGAQ